MSGDPAIDEGIAWTLGGIRVVSAFAAAPVFRLSALPVRIRAALGMLVALAIAPALPVPAIEAGALGLGMVVLHEALIGLALGFSLRLLVVAAELLGEFVSIQGGLGAAAVVDPTSGASSLALATTFQFFAWMTFLAIDGHHSLVRALAITYEQIPLGTIAPEPSMFLAVAQLASGVFAAAVRMAAPITAAMLAANVGVGILGRAVPQLNLMMLQLPALVMVTLTLVALGAGVLVNAIADHLAVAGEQSLLTVMGGG